MCLELLYCVCICCGYDLFLRLNLYLVSLRVLHDVCMIWIWLCMICVCVVYAYCMMCVWVLCVFCVRLNDVWLFVVGVDMSL